MPSSFLIDTITLPLKKIKIIQSITLHYNHYSVSAHKPTAHARYNKQNITQTVTQLQKLRITTLHYTITKAQKHYTTQIYYHNK